MRRGAGERRLDDGVQRLAESSTVDEELQSVSTPASNALALAYDEADSSDQVGRQAEVRVVRRMRQVGDGFEKSKLVSTLPTNIVRANKPRKVYCLLAGMHGRRHGRLVRASSDAGRGEQALRTHTCIIRRKASERKGASLAACHSVEKCGGAPIRTQRDAESDRACQVNASKATRD